MAKPNPAAWRAVVAEHRAAFDRLTQRTAPAQVKKLYDRAQGELVAKLRAKTAAGRGDTFGAQQHRLLLLQVRHGQAMAAQQLAQGMNAATKAVQTDSLRGLIRDVTRLEHHYTGAEVVLPIEEASRFAGVIEARRPTLLRMHQLSFARYGSVVVSKMEDDMALSLATGETTAEAIDRLEATAGVEWWRAERIVRTETAYAFNATHADGIAEADEELGDMYGMWSEHTDASGAPLDDRVGVDSLAMAGQVAKPGQAFVMPPTSPVADMLGNQVVPAGLVGQSWECPPNRPNDRSVLTPWRPHWGIPGWTWNGSRRVPVTR